MLRPHYKYINKAFKFWAQIMSSSARLYNFGWHNTKQRDLLQDLVSGKEESTRLTPLIRQNLQGLQRLAPNRNQDIAIKTLMILKRSFGKLKKKAQGKPGPKPGRPGNRRDGNGSETEWHVPQLVIGRPSDS